MEDKNVLSKAHFTMGFNYPIPKNQLSPSAQEYIRDFKEDGYYIFLSTKELESYYIKEAKFNDGVLDFDIVSSYLHKARINGVILGRNTYEILLSTANNKSSLTLTGVVDVEL